MREGRAQAAEAKVKFLLRCLPQGFSPKGDSHSKTAAAQAVASRRAKMETQRCVEKGTRNPSKGTVSA